MTKLLLQRWSLVVDRLGHVPVAQIHYSIIQASVNVGASVRVSVSFKFRIRVGVSVRICGAGQPGGAFWGKR